MPADQIATSFTLETSLRLDFGKTTTPVAAGYRRLVETDLYAPAAGYGWQDNTMKSYDRARRRPAAGFPLCTPRHIPGGPAQRSLRSGALDG